MLAQRKRNPNKLQTKKLQVYGSREKGTNSQAKKGGVRNW
jgi:hypothetical protein